MKHISTEESWISFLGTGWQLDTVEGYDLITCKPVPSYQLPVSSSLCGICELWHSARCLSFKVPSRDLVQQTGAL